MKTNKKTFVQITTILTKCEICGKEQKYLVEAGKLWTCDEESCIKKAIDKVSENKELKNEIF